jgi:hypothetical protein
VRGNTRFISSVEHDISRVSAANEWDIMFNTRNKSGISAHPCIFLFQKLFKRCSTTLVYQVLFNNKFNFEYRNLSFKKMIFFSFTNENSLRMSNAKEWTI